MLWIYIILALFASSAAAFTVIPTSSYVSRKSPFSKLTFGPSIKPRSALPPNYHLSSLRGGSVADIETLEDLDLVISKATKQGKAVCIDFSATWCPPCKMIRYF